MEATQHKIYEIEEQESKHQINKANNEANQQIQPINDAEIFESKSDYGDKVDLLQKAPQTDSAFQAQQQQSAITGQFPPTATNAATGQIMGHPDNEEAS